MNSDTFSFSLLQYHHSQVLGEILNIGLVAYFPEQRVLKFICPEKLIRLRLAYPEVPEKTLRKYFKFFNNRVDQVNSKREIFTDFDIDFSLELFLNKEFIAPDSSSLQFGKVKKSVLYTKDIDAISNQLYNLYFSVFNQQDSITHKIDESTLLSKYKKLFHEFSFFANENKIPSSKIKYDYQLTANSGNTVIFDIAWEASNKLHLVKPISFDLTETTRIINKAYRYSGEFTDLENVPENNRLNFDVLIARPSEKTLFSAYDKATNLLSSHKSVNIIEFNVLKEYAKNTFELLQFEN